MLGVMGGSYYFQHSQSKDHEKIEKIAESLGLYTKEEKIRLFRKRKDKNHIEYVYKIPLGLSFKEFEDKKQVFIDGLNNKSRPDLNIENLKKMDWKGNVPKQVKQLINNRKPLDKQIEMEYDGMLKMRVYEEGVGMNYPLTLEHIHKCKKWHIPLGVTMKSEVKHNFENAPHMLIGGATDMGKSTYLNVIIATLIKNAPEDVEFTLIDLKGGLEFGIYEDLKQVKRFASDVPSAAEALQKVKVEMSDTFDLLKRKKKRNVKQLGMKKRHFVIIDESAELSSEGEQDKDIKELKVQCESFIKDIARRGRASGIRLLYSTQYPTRETVSSQVKRNLTTRIALSCDTSTASMVVLDEGGAENLGWIQGRSIYKRNSCQTIQGYYIDDELIEQIISPHRRRKEDAPHQDKTTGTRGEDSAIFEEA